MDEIGFVIKSFLMSVFAVFLMQMKVGNDQSVESLFVSYMQKTWATQWMKDMGGGAVRATASVYNNTLGEVIKQQKATLNKVTDVKANLKDAEALIKKKEQELNDIENR